MALPVTLPRHTPEEYLAIEREAEFKSEYIDGHVIARTGGSPEHSRINVDLLVIVNPQVRDTLCEGFDSDMRVRVDADMYTYPDLTVVCGESQFRSTQGDVLLNPTVVFEVLSPSTEAYDRGEKFNRYQGMPSLKEYVLVNQSKARIEVFKRSPGDVWTFSRAEGLDASIEIESIGCTLPLRDVYRRMTFNPD